MSATARPSLLPTALQPAEVCRACGSSVTFRGAHGCRGTVRTCREAWHCRDALHRHLAHCDDSGGATRQPAAENREPLVLRLQDLR